jgi:pyruvate/2-oxoglutarate dehydrogenase complex dihydrolipoamide acyltransferase (E2) component
MIREGESCKTRKFPLMRRMIVDAGRDWRNSSIVYGILEVDVTEPRRIVREHKQRTGETLSLTAYLAACLARAIEADRSLHALRDWRNRLVMFDDVDVSVAVEVKSNGRSYPLIHVLRGANRRTFREIHDEIRSVQSTPRTSAGIGRAWWIRPFLSLPWVLRNCAYWFFRRSPVHWKRMGGTASITSLGMFGKGGGWGLPLVNHTVGACIGGISERPGFVGDRIERREFLCVTVAVNHDIVDGGPAVRFTNRFRELIESGELLAADGQAA